MGENNVKNQTFFVRHPSKPDAGASKALFPRWSVRTIISRGKNQPILKPRITLRSIQATGSNSPRAVILIVPMLQRGNTVLDAPASRFVQRQVLCFPKSPFVEDNSVRSNAAKA